MNWSLTRFLEGYLRKPPILPGGSPKSADLRVFRLEIHALRDSQVLPNKPEGTTGLSSK